MRIRNFKEVGRSIAPESIRTYGLTKINYDKLIQYTDLKGTLYLMNGPIPATDELYNVNNRKVLEKNYKETIVEKFELGFDFIFSTDKLERTIVKHIPDALDFTYSKDANIQWFAYTFKNYDLFELDDNYYSHILYQEGVTNNTTSFIYKFHNYQRAPMKLDAFYIETTGTLDISTFKIETKAYIDKSTTVQQLNNIVLNNIAENRYLITFDTVDIDFQQQIAIYLNYAGGSAATDFRVLTSTEYLEENILFSDSVGTWYDDDAFVMLETTVGDIGDRNILKDFKIVIRDLADLDAQTQPPSILVDDQPGLLTVNTIGDNDTITNDMVDNGFLITGTTLGIEDEQIVKLIFNNVRYEGTVRTNAWLITIPSTDSSQLQYEADYEMKFTVADRAGNETIVTKLVHVNRFNTAPVLSIPESVITDEDTPIDITVEITDDVSVASVQVSSLNGVVSYLNNVITYTPNQDYYGSDIITIIATDDEGESTTGTISVTVNPVDDAPVISIIDSITVPVDSVTNISYNISDIDTDLTNITINVSATNGTVDLDTVNNAIIYTAPSSAGNDTITLEVSDGNQTITSTVSVTVN